MGVFHCTWMNDIGSSTNFYYITKSYKGSSVTMCQNSDELKSYRCYRHLPLHYSYYGTGHVIYKGYMFYNQEETRDLVVHSVEKSDTKKVSAPDDAECCDMDNYLYNVKHSGYFDFEADENGLWLIYKLNYEISNRNTENFMERVDDTYVIAKIDENDLKSLRIEKNGLSKLIALKWQTCLLLVGNCTRLETQFLTQLLFISYAIYTMTLSAQSLMKMIFLISLFQVDKLPH